MAYSIEYFTSDEAKKPKVNFRQIGVVLLILAIVVAAVVIKSASLPFVKEVLLPGDPAVTAMALDALVEDICDGASVIEAFKAFCKEIVDGAYAS